MVRWRAVAEAGGAPVEALVLEAGDPESRRRFLQVHRTLAALPDPGLLRTRATLEAEGRAVAIRDPVEDAGLERIRGPLEPAVVARIGVVVGRAALASGDLLRGLLRPEDVGIGPDGRPLLAPWGGTTGRVDRDRAHLLTPGGAPAADPAAALHGLGVLLWTLATGRPWSRLPPGVSPLAPGVLRPGLPPRLDEAILALLALEPGIRPGALVLLEELAATSIDLRPHLAPPPPQLPVRPRAAPPTRRGADAGSLVLLPAGVLAGLDPERRSLVAAWTGLPDRFLDELDRKGLPVVMERTAGARAARRRARELAERTGLPVDWGSSVGLPGWLPLSLGGAAALAATALAVGLAMAGILPAALVALGLAAALGGAGAWAGRRAGRRRATWREGRESARRAEVLLAEHSAGGRLSDAFQRLAETRRAVAQAALPPTIAADLRSSLKGVERGLLRLGEAARGSPPPVDAEELRRRLAALEASGAAEARLRERERLARTLADLEASEEQRARVVDRQQELVDHLDAILAAVARIDGADDPDLDRLVHLLREGP